MGNPIEVIALKTSPDVEVKKHLVHASRTFIKEFSTKIEDKELKLQFVCEEIRGVECANSRNIKGFSDPDCPVNKEKFINMIRAVYGITSDSNCRFNHLMVDIVRLVRPQVRMEFSDKIDQLLRRVYNDEDIIEFKKHGSP